MRIKPEQLTQTKANEGTDQNPKPPIDSKGERGSELEVPPMPVDKPARKGKP